MCDTIWPMIANPQFIDIELKESIAEAVDEFAKQKKLEGIKSLSRYNPKKVGLILYLWSQGVSQSTMVKKYHLSHGTIKHTLIEYANHTTRWRKLGVEINRRLFLELSSIEEDMVSDLQQRLSSGELKPTFSDLLPVSVALDKAERQAMRAIEDVGQVNYSFETLTLKNSLSELGINSYSGASRVIQFSRSSED